MYFAAPDESNWIGVLRVGVRVPGSRSLKEKRKSIAQIRDRIRGKKNYTVAEIGHLEDHQRAVLSIGLVANEQRFIQSALDHLAHEIGTWRSAVLEEATVLVMPIKDEMAKTQYDGFING